MLTENSPFEEEHPMRIPSNPVLCATGRWLAALVLVLRPDSVESVRAAEPDQTKPEAAVYDADPQHLWNRLYDALYVRVTEDGQSFGRGELDPLLWEHSTYLLAEPRYSTVLGLLNEFLDKDGEKLSDQPLKRALFQHDLWAVFDWLADPNVEYALQTAKFGEQRHALRVRLAAIIRRLALSAEEIDKLPDNYGIAVASAAWPRTYDPAHAEKAFLPPDLFAANGPWVHVQTGGSKRSQFVKPTALTHVYFVGGRSSFHVFMNLPGGRQKTLGFLPKLNTPPRPHASPAAAATGSTSHSHSQPPLPPGTRLALVRQMMLVDDKGEARLSRLIESLQIRIVHPADEKQNYFYEFTLDRQELLGGKSGLRAGKSDQVMIPLFNQTHDKDLFESPVQVRKLRESAAQRARQEPVTENLRSICVSCHQHPEMGSATTFFHDQSPELTAAERVNEVERILNWKRDKYQWGLLQGLTADQRLK